MFYYDKVIQKHLDVLSKYDDPEALDTHIEICVLQYRSVHSDYIYTVCCGACR